MGKPAAYDNDRADLFPVAEKNGMKTTTIIGAEAPNALDNHVQARRSELVKGEHLVELLPDNVAGLFLFDGELTLSAIPMQKGDVALSEKE